MDLKHAKVEFQNNEPVNTGSTVAEKIQRKKLYIGVAFSLLLLGAGFIFALLLQYTVNHAAWLIFSIYGIFVMTLIAVSTTISPKRLWRAVAIAMFALPVVALAFSVWNTLFLLCGSVIMFFSGERIRESLHNMCKMNIGQALHTGIGGLFFGIAIIVSSQYFTLIAQYDTENLLPRIDSMMSSNGVIEKFLPANDASGGIMTIDRFLEKFLADRITSETAGDSNALLGTVTQTAGIAQEDIQDLLAQNSLGADLLANVENTYESAGEQIVVSARNDIGGIIGKQLTGNERVSDVFFLFAQAQMKKVVLGNALISQSLPKILALLLFVTIISFVVLLRIPVIWLTKVSFMLLSQTALFEVKERAVEVERISYNTYQN